MCRGHVIAGSAAGCIVGLAAGILLTGSAHDIIIAVAWICVPTVLIGAGLAVGVQIERRAADKRLDVALALRREGERQRAADGWNWDVDTVDQRHAEGERP